MKALDRKLLRDLRAMWSQVLTIALVVASGIGGFITSLSAVDLRISTSAAAPSEIELELAGVTVPSFLNAGLSVGILST